MYTQYNFIRLDFNILVFCIWHNNVWFNWILRWEPFVMHVVCPYSLQWFSLLACCDRNVPLNLLIGLWWKYRNMIADLGWFIVRLEWQRVGDIIVYFKPVWLFALRSFTTCPWPPSASTLPTFQRMSGLQQHSFTTM